MFSELTLMLKLMTSLSSRLPAYFVIPALLPEENVPRFQGHGIPVSASGNLNSLGLLTGPSWQSVLLKACGFGTKEFVFSPRVIQKYLRDSPEESLRHDAPWDRVLKFSQMLCSS